MIENTQNNSNTEQKIKFSSKSCHAFVNRWLINHLHLKPTDLEILLSKYGNMKLPVLLRAYNSSTHSIKCTDASGKKAIIIMDPQPFCRGKITFKTDSYEKVFEVNNATDTFTVTSKKTVLIKDDKRLEDIHKPEFAFNIFFYSNNIHIRLEISNNEAYANDFIVKRKNEIYNFLFNLELPFNPIETYENLKNLLSLYAWWNTSCITLAECPDAYPNERSKSFKVSDLITKGNLLVIKNGHISEIRVKEDDTIFCISSNNQWSMFNNHGSMVKTLNNQIVYSGVIDCENLSSVNLQQDLLVGEALFEKYKKYVQ